MRRSDLTALGSGALIGAVVALAVVLVWSVASRPSGFPTTEAALPTPTTGAAPSATVTTTGPKLPITLTSDGLGLASFGEQGDAVVAELEGFLGAPDSDEQWTCPDAEGNVRFVQWADLGVFLLEGVFRGWVDGVHYPPDYGPLLGLTMPEGLGIGVGVEHFEAHLGDRFVLSDAEIPEGDARPFDIDGPTGIHGFVEERTEGSPVIVLMAGPVCFPDPR